jgi:hypothetical protein
MNCLLVSDYTSQTRSYISLCSPYVSRRFGGTYHLHIQGRKSDEQETSVQQVPSKRRFTYELYGAVSQKMATFICIAVITSNPTLCFSATLQYGQTSVNADQIAYVNCNSHTLAPVILGARSPSNQCNLSFEMNGGAPPRTIHTYTTSAGVKRFQNSTEHRLRNEVDSFGEQTSIRWLRVAGR